LRAPRPTLPEMHIDLLRMRGYRAEPAKLAAGRRAVNGAGAPSLSMVLAPYGPQRENALPALTGQGLCHFDALNDFNRYGGSPCWRFTGQLALSAASPP